MKLTRTPFDGLVILEPKVLTDHRGHFFESFNKRTYNELGLSVDLVQENQSHSVKNVIRGLHFQKEPHAQTKVVRVLKGRILDVVVDLRRNQPTFKTYFSVELSEENKKCLFVPKGFAHGFSVLSDEADVQYCCDEFYYPDCEAGILYNDPTLSIDWRIAKTDAIISAKDLALPDLKLNAYTF